MATAVKGQVRKERAAATRRKVLQAATAEFAEHGYVATTMAAIAERAGVAVQTVYFAFRTKPELLTAAIDAAVLGDDPVPPGRTAWHREATTHPDPRTAMSAFITGTLSIEQRAAGLKQAVQAAAQTDADVAVVRDRHEQLRAAGFGGFARSLAERGMLADGVTPEHATDVLLAMAGAGLFLELTRERGWDVDSYGSWLTDALCRLLLVPS